MQILKPDNFIGWLPEEASLIPIDLVYLVLGNGIFETICGILLILGVFTRIAALLLGIHLAGITFTIGFSEIGIRDLGLTIATLSIFFTGDDVLCLDKHFMKSSLDTAL